MQSPIGAIRHLTAEIITENGEGIARWITFIRRNRNSNHNPFIVRKVFITAVIGQALFFLDAWGSIAITTDINAVAIILRLATIINR